MFKSHIFKLSLIIFLSSSGFSSLNNKFVPFDPQNALVLQQSIPSELQGLPFVIYPLQTGAYNVNRFNFNKRFNIFPKAIIIPRSNQELACVFRILKKLNLDFVVRSGGHCFEPGSLSPNYILDLRNFRSMILRKNELYVGAGVRLGAVIELLGRSSLAIPTGTCETVGISGLTLGGGIGFLARTFGLTCDALKRIYLLNANGQIIAVDQEHNPDLFWALRGAGNNSYGIAVGFTFKTFPVSAASFFELKWDWDQAPLSTIFNTWQTWITNLPNSINPVLSMGYANGQLSISIVGLKVGSDPFIEWQAAFAPLNPQVNIKNGSYLQLAKLWEDSPTTPFAKVKSLMAFTPISNSVFAQTINYFQDLRNIQAPFQVNFQFVALGGQYAQGDTAFFPRNAFEWWHQVASWDQQDQGPAALASLRAFYASIAPQVSNYCYSNDTDFDLGPSYLNAYYGDKVNRLIQIKNQFDPTNLFHWQQSIRP